MGNPKRFFQNLIPKQHRVTFFICWIIIIASALTIIYLTVEKFDRAMVYSKSEGESFTAMLKEEYLEPPFICGTIENGTFIVYHSGRDPMFSKVLPYPLGSFLDNVKPELSLTVIIIFFLIILRYIKLRGLKVRSAQT